VRREQMASFLARALRLEVVPTPERVRHRRPHIGEQAHVKIIDRYRTRPPGDLSMIEFRSSSDITPSQLAEVRAELAPAVRHFGAVPATLWVSGDDEYLAAAFHEARPDLTRKQARDATAGMVGMATMDHVFVHLPRTRATGGSGFMAHEYVHVVQYTWMGVVAPEILPVWLAEGQANLYGHVLAYTASVTVDPRSYYYDVGNQREYKLADFERRSATRASNGEYSLGGVAVEYLINRFGEDKLVQYWSTYRGGEWKPAFEQVFGVSVASFYADFERYRTTL
jgi:hypothetical protein